MSIKTIQNRVSSPLLDAPAPNAEERQQIITAALRAPDHGALRPWRFLWMEGQALEDFSQILYKAVTQENRGDRLLEKSKKMPFRAPAILAVVSSPKESEKIPLVDQRYSAAAAAQNVLLACEALGFASIWRTGWPVESEVVKCELGLAIEEEIVALIYIGTRKGSAREIPQHDPSDFVSIL